MVRAPRQPVHFAAPPVVEVAIAVQFDALERLTTPHLGRFWTTVADEFPTVEEHLPRPSTMESFPQRQEQVQQVMLQLTGRSPVSRCRFISEDDSRIIQVQADRFVFNWRKRPGAEEYPRYSYVREQFDRYLELFIEFIAVHELGAIRPNQCEISYVNALPHLPGQISALTPLWSGKHSDEFLPIPSSTQSSLVYDIRDEEGAPAKGRLRITLSSEHSATLHLTARGAPDPEDFDGVGAFLELGHEWVVRGFRSVTTNEMHALWQEVVE